MFRFSDMIRFEPEKKGKEEEKEEKKEEEKKKEEKKKEEKKKEDNTDSSSPEKGFKISDIVPPPPRLDQKREVQAEPAPPSAARPTREQPSSEHRERSILPERAPTAEPDPGRTGEVEARVEDAEAFLRSLDEDVKRYRELHLQVVEYMTEVLRSVRENRGFSIEKGMEIIRGLLKERDAMNLFMVTDDASLEGVEHLVLHSINVMATSLKIGVGLGYSDDDLGKLSLAALLHDLGMLRVPDRVRNKSGKLSENELKLIREHPIYSYKIIMAQGERYEWLADIIAQEHERVSGSGYPRKLKGDEIHEYAKIIGLADVYQAMTHSRPHRKAHLPFETFNDLVKSQKKEFPSKILKALVNQMTVFPLFSYVKLNTSAVGRVIKIDERVPMKPTIVILYDSKQRKLETPKVVDLRSSPLLYIVDCVDIEEVEKSA